uniref:Uncharacterized protein n=1 Tax=Hucho hucho TaxID=62062 RepID=A0A4W5JT02_9TELE
MLGDMAIEGGNFTTAFFKQQTIRELFDVTEGEKKEVTVELSVPQPEEEETVNKQSTTILEQALCRAEDEEDIVAASQAKAEQVAELAEFNEAIPLDEAGEGRDPEEEELSKAEQEIAALVEQLTPIERYAMNFLEDSLEDVCKEELKQAEEQVEAARKGLDQAKEEGLKLQAGSSDNDDEDFSSQPEEEPSTPGSGRRPRKHKEKGAPSTRTSGRLRGTTASPPPTSPEPDTPTPTPREVPERLRSALRGRGGTKDTTTPARTERPRAHTTSARLQESAKPAVTTLASPSRDSSLKSGSAAPPLRTQSHSSSVPSTATSPPAGKPLTQPGESDTESPRREQGVCVSSDSMCPVDHQSYSAQARDYDSRDQKSLSPPLVCSLSRSPRKRQSADGEVLLGLPEHSPSAKVLRKLPGRLVTVVEDKEPRKRRRCSGTGGGSSEETEHAESGRGSNVPSRDTTPQTPDKTNQSPKEKGTASKYSSKITNLPEDQESPLRHTHPARSYPPYSPPHHSPDMPVLRNLPVRRRLESESRVAAQLGEQGLGRGRGGNYHRKMDTQPGKEGNVSSGTNVANSTPLLKRKRGRPPKTPLRVVEPQPEHVSPPHPHLPSEEGSPPLSPKRKRGRPRKDSTTVTNAVGAGKNSNAPTASTTSQAGSLSDTAAADTEPLAPSAPTKSQTVATSAFCTSQASPSTKAEDSTATLKADTKTEFPTTTPTAILAPSPAQVLTTTAVPAPSRTQVPTSIPISVSVSTSNSTDVPASSSSTISTSVPVAVSSTSSPTVPALNSNSVPASSLPTVSTPSSHTVSASRMTFGHASRSTSGPIRIPTAVLTSTLAQFLTSRPRVTTSPPVSTSPSISTTTTTQIFTPIPTPALAQIPKIATLASTSTSTPTPTFTNVKPTPTPVPTTVVTTNLPTFSKPTTTSIANLTTISTPAPPRIVTTVTPAPTTAATAALATTFIPTSTKITTTTPTPGPTPTITSDPNTTVKPTHTQIPTTINTTSVPIPNNIPTAAPTRTVPTVTPSRIVPTVTAAPATTSITTSTKITPTPTITSTATPDPTTTVKPTHTPVPTTLTTTSVPIPNTIPTAATTRTVTTVTAATTTTPNPTPSQVPTTITTKIHTQIPTPSSTQGPPLAQIPITSSISTAVAATENQALEPAPVETAHNRDSEKITDMRVDTQETKEDRNTEEDGEEEISDSQLKKRKVENSPEAKDTVPPTPSLADPEAPVAPRPEETDKQKVEESVGDDRAASKKRPLSRQNSQESVRSSSLSSVCSTPTRSAQHKKGAEKRAPAKRMRGEVFSDPEKGQGETKKDFTNATPRQSRSSSSDSDTSEIRKERLLTHSAQSRQETEGDGESNGRIGRPARSSERVGKTVSNNTGTEESGSQRVTRKSSVPQPTPERKPQSNSVPSSPSQPEVLGKRCSALNAAAKLLAMRGRIDTPGSRRDPAAKTSGQNATSPASTDKNQKSKSKSVPATPQTNCNNNKVGISKTTTPTQSSRTAARSTRQCPGALVPALELNNKRGSKKEEREKKPSERKEEGERETRSSRGHSAYSSMSSDGGGSSRSSSSSLSSQSTGPRRNQSRAPSSGSERERSTERGRRRSHRKEGEGRGRETRKERKERHAQKRERLSQEGNAGSGEGTPDRVLRSVAAMAAAQARTPAANTRSSSAQHNKT